MTLLEKKAMNRCDITGCQEEAVKVQWFTRGIGRQDGHLCDEHRDELWNTLGPLCAANEAAIIIGEK